MQVQQHIYLQDYRRHSVDLSQRRNGHMQVNNGMFSTVLINREIE